MTTPRSIVEDAERIAAFGMRSGQITDAGFYEAVSNAAAVGNEIKWSDPAMKALGAPLGKAVEAVGPDILVGLKTGWDPYEPSGRPHRRSRWFCLALTFMMIVVGAYYTLWHARTAELLKFEFARSVTDQEEAVRRMMLPLLAATVQTDDPAPDAPIVSASTASPAGQPAAPDTARLGLLLEATDDVRQLHQSIARYRERLDYLHEGRLMWQGQAKAAYMFLEDVHAYLGSAEGRPPWSPDRVEWQDPDVLMKEQVDLLMRAASVQRETVREICASGDQPAVIKAFLGQRADVGTTADALVNVRTLRECFLLALGVNSAIKGDGYETKFDELEHMLTVVNNWLLPALYGALGALVYYMRQFLNPLRPNPGLARVVMRVSLGALAGILIAWFQTTTASNDGLGITTLGLGSLMIAFIVGFSIDVFFNALERVVQSANAAIEKPAEASGRPANG